MIGALEWANSSRSWLGVRLETGLWGFFWGELESNPVPNPKAQIAFVTNKNKFGETALIAKYDDMLAKRTSLTTLDHRGVYQLGNARLIAEGAYQWGRKGGNDHDSWAATVRGELPVARDLQIYAKGNIATGGSGHAFDNLYPTNHLYYGMMDLQGWSNMKGLALGATWQASRALSFDLSFHDFSLYDKTDGWYGATGVVNKLGGVPVIDPAGLSGSHVGAEVDMVARLRTEPNLTLEAGVAFFSPGQFVKSFIEGSTARSTFGYVQAGYRF